MGDVLQLAHRGIEQCESSGYVEAPLLRKLVREEPAPLDRRVAFEDGYRLAEEFLDAIKINLEQQGQIDVEAIVRRLKIDAGSMALIEAPGRSAPVERRAPFAVSGRHCAAIWTCGAGYGEHCVEGRTVQLPWRVNNGCIGLCLEGRCRSCESDARRPLRARVLLLAMLTESVEWGQVPDAERDELCKAVGLDRWAQVDEGRQACVARGEVGATGTTYRTASTASLAGAGAVDIERWVFGRESSLCPALTPAPS